MTQEEREIVERAAPKVAQILGNAQNIPAGFHIAKTGKNAGKLVKDRADKGSTRKPAPEPRYGAITQTQAGRMRDLIATKLGRLTEWEASKDHCDACEAAYQSATRELDDFIAELTKRA